MDVYEQLNALPDDCLSNPLLSLIELCRTGNTESYRLELMEEGPSEDWRSLPVNKIIAWLQAE